MSPHNTFESRAGAGAHREGARGLLGVLGARQSQRVLGAHRKPVGCQLHEGAHTTSERWAVVRAVQRSRALKARGPLSKKLC